MKMVWTRLLLVAAACAACAACSSQPSTEDAETAALSPLKTEYAGVVMGFDIHDTAVDVSIDLNNLQQMDEDKEDALKAEAPKMWAKAWSASHPNQHATLTTRIIDFQGTEIAKTTTKV